MNYYLDITIKQSFNLQEIWCTYVGKMQSDFQNNTDNVPN